MKPLAHITVHQTGPLAGTRARTKSKVVVFHTPIVEQTHPAGLTIEEMHSVIQSKLSPQDLERLCIVQYDAQYHDTTLAVAERFTHGAWEEPINVAAGAHSELLTQVYTLLLQGRHVLIQSPSAVICNQLVALLTPDLFAEYVAPEVEETDGQIRIQELHELNSPVMQLVRLNNLQSVVRYQQKRLISDTRLLAPRIYVIMYHDRATDYPAAIEVATRLVESFVEPNITPNVGQTRAVVTHGSVAQANLAANASATAVMVLVTKEEMGRLEAQQLVKDYLDRSRSIVFLMHLDKEASNVPLPQTSDISIFVVADGIVNGMDITPATA